MNKMVNGPDAGCASGGISMHGPDMAGITIQDLVSATGGTLLREGVGPVVGVSTDSRTIKRGELFVPLVGESFDGHDFIPTAVANGASGVLSRPRNHERPPDGVFVIEVADTLKALQDLAAYIRRSHPDTRVVGITGSNGKTTTKEMLASVLSTRGPVLKNVGNLNNHIGLPLTLAGLDGTHWAAVLEMGMSGPGEIDLLARIANPDVGVITNIGMAHIGRIGSVRAVAEAKSELVRALPEHGVAVINSDDPNLAGLLEAPRVKTVTFGLGARADYTAENIRALPDGVAFRLVGRLAGPGTATEVSLPVIGMHNVMNALAAAAAAGELGITPDEAASGLAGFRPAGMRMQIMELGGLRVINDAYNANPSSMAVALTTLFTTATGGKAAVLGDMLELGEAADEAHYNVGRLAGSGGLKLLVLIGEQAGAAARGAVEAGMDESGIFVAKDSDDAARAVLSRLSGGDTLLIKGSRGMRLEAVVERLKAGRYAG